nr:MAG TPA: hypothetical protein [Caudoviricetes sp.]
MGLRALFLRCENKQILMRFDIDVTHLLLT